MGLFLEKAKSIASSVAARHAEEVDALGRFPDEAISALRNENLMSIYVPTAYGGAGVSPSEISAISEALGTYCASTAMAFAMHQIQVACLVHHGQESDYFKNYLSEIVKSQPLIASMTSEVGVGGDMRSSVCALQTSGDRFFLAKDSTTMSYCAQADDFLVTSRKDSAAQKSEQVLTLVRGSQAKLEIKGKWDTMGLRGTCSPPCKLEASGSTEQVFKVPFSVISAQTMVPFAHIAWAGCWLGTASAAINKASSFVRTQARARPGVVPPSAMRLAELVADFQTYRCSVQALTQEYEDLCKDLPANLDKMMSISYALRMNNMKISGAELLPKFVQKAFSICGVMGFKKDSKFSMDRHIRDSFSAGVMVANDRILGSNSGMLTVIKGF